MSNKTSNILIIFLLLTISGCGRVYWGSSYNSSSFNDFPENSVSAIKAIKLAEPYLDKTFELRSALRDWPSKEDKEPVVHVVLKGKYYYIVKENYPYKYIEAYLPHAVKVNKNTGQVYPPK